MTWIIALVLFIIVVALLELLIKRRRRNLSPFIKRERVMDEYEKSLFDNLQKTLGNDYVVLSKVRVEDFVEVDQAKISDRNKWWGYRNMIKSRHVDFLICDRSTTKPLLAVELDGKSHNNLARQERDQNMDDIYNAISLPIKHISVGSNFEKEVEDISNILRNKPL